MKALAEVIKFAGAMLLVAGVIFGGFWLVIHGGGLLLQAWFHLLSPPLPRSIALALAVMLTPLCVYGAWYWLAERRRKARIAA